MSSSSCAGPKSVGTAVLFRNSFLGDCTLWLLFDLDSLLDCTYSSYRECKAQTRWSASCRLSTCVFASQPRKDSHNFRRAGSRRGSLWQVLLPGIFPQPLTAQSRPIFAKFTNNKKEYKEMYKRKNLKKNADATVYLSHCRSLLPTRV